MTIRTIAYIIGLIIFIYMLVEVWRSPMSLLKKIIWTIASFIFTLIALIVWFIWGRKNAYGKS